MNSSLTKSGIIFLLTFLCFQSFGQVNESKSETPTVEPQQEPVYDIVDEPAEFPGGLAALKGYMMQNMEYPQTALEMGLQGKVFLQFYILEDGSITSIKIKKGVVDCPECDAEAVRMVKSMPKWKPAKVKGKAVNSTFSLPVSFKLN